MRNRVGIVCLGMFVSALSPSASAQQEQLADVSIQGFVYEPQRLPATDARIQSLTVPQGFQVRRFAEGLDNPRMLAVADGRIGERRIVSARYHFQIFALDTRLDLPDGFNRHALLQAMRGHVLAEGELIGTFQAPQYKRGT